jgi:hypothetical protein
MPSNPPIMPILLLLTLLLVGSVGCQQVHQGISLPGITASSQDKKAVQLAKQDPFPSPADVGITAPAE